MFTELKSNQHACSRKQTQIKSATRPVKSQMFGKGFVNRLQINVTFYYTNYLFCRNIITLRHIQP